MSWITILDLVLSLLQSSLISLGANDKYRKVASEVQSAVDALARARTETLTNTELETLRTTPQW